MRSTSGRPRQVWGSFCFVAAVLIAFRAAGAFFNEPIAQARVAAAYVIGSISMIWLISRVGSFAI